VSFYDPQQLVRDAQIVENYRFELQGWLDEDESMRCRARGFSGGPDDRVVVSRFHRRRRNYCLCKSRALREMSSSYCVTGWILWCDPTIPLYRKVCGPSMPSLTERHFSQVGTDYGGRVCPAVHFLSFFLKNA
jgi:hypothetical protein